MRVLDALHSHATPSPTIWETPQGTSNTRISFLNGVHDINKSGVLLIKKVFNFTLAGYNVSRSNTAKIRCLQPAILRFNKITNLVINHLSVLYCGYPVLQFVNGKELSSAALYFLNIFSLKLSIPSLWKTALDME